MCSSCVCVCGPTFIAFVCFLSFFQGLNILVVFGHLTDKKAQYTEHIMLEELVHQSYYNFKSRGKLGWVRTNVYMDDLPLSLSL